MLSLPPLSHRSDYDGSVSGLAEPSVPSTDSARSETDAFGHHPREGGDEGGAVPERRARKVRRQEMGPRAVVNPHDETELRHRRWPGKNEVWYEPLVWTVPSFETGHTPPRSCRASGGGRVESPRGDSPPPAAPSRRRTFLARRSSYGSRCIMKNATASMMMPDMKKRRRRRKARTQKCTHLSPLTAHLSPAWGNRERPGR